QDSAVTNVAICVVHAIAIKKALRWQQLQIRHEIVLTIVTTLRVGMQFVGLCVTRRFSLSGG
ncbi:hypothetical protein, partial [Pseudomonas syringae]|uniref:hypothetical protein n=1 Tax=Pseudomonas syringae TaxID=317 RepID=UPI001E443B77